MPKGRHNHRWDTTTFDADRGEVVQPCRSFRNCRTNRVITAGTTSLQVVDLGGNTATVKEWPTTKQERSIHLEALGEYMEDVRGR